MNGLKRYCRDEVPARNWVEFIAGARDSMVPDEDFVVVERNPHGGDVWIQVHEGGTRGLVMLTPKKARRLAFAILKAAA